MSTLHFEDEDIVPLKEPKRVYFDEQILKYCLIVLSILLMFGNNYAFDIPQALEEQIETDLQISQVEFNLLYSVFAVPNIGLSIGGGMMIDAIGGRWGLFTFSFLVWISQMAITLGGTYEKFYMMLVGRAIFGVASDMLFISISKIIVKRCGDQQGFALGLVLTVPELASALNSVLSPYLFEKSHTLTLPLLFGFSICLISFICGLLVIALDISFERNVRSQIFLQDEQSKAFEFSQLRKPFYMLMVIATLNLSVYVPFLDNVNKFYQERFGWSEQKAGRVVMIGYAIAALSSPLIGHLSDVYKKQRKLLIVITTSLFLVSHLQFFLLKQGTQQLPNEFSIFGLITLGLAYACYSGILLPALQAVVPDGYFATALGILGVAENICLACVPIISGIIYGEWSRQTRMRAVDSIYLLMAMVSFFLSVKFYTSKVKLKNK